MSGEAVEDTNTILASLGAKGTMPDVLISPNATQNTKPTSPITEIKVSQTVEEQDNNRTTTIIDDEGSQKTEIDFTPPDKGCQVKTNRRPSIETAPTEFFEKVTANIELKEDSLNDVEIAEKVTANIGLKEDSLNDVEAAKGCDDIDYDPKNITYEGDIAIYTNRETGHQYQWNTESETWVIRENIGSYDFENDTHTFTDKDGVTFEWDKEKRAWFPKIDDDFMARYQMNYGFATEVPPDKSTTEEKQVVKAIEKPKEQLMLGQKRKPSDPKWFEPDQDQTTQVYVSNLPLDITDDEFLELMQKCGIVMRDPTTNQMRIKLYKEWNSDILKGDGLCTYVRRESIDLAFKLIDGSDLRGKKIKVELAKFQMKGDYDPTLKPKSKKRKDKMKLKMQQEKMFDWRPEKMIGERAKNERIVILKNVFESKIFDEDVGLILEFQQDLREECSKCGDVKKVILYDRHPDGVAQVNMSAPEEADEVVKLLNGRWFGKRKLSAEIWDGKTKYKIQETDAQITQRLGNWNTFLEDEKDVEKHECESKIANK